jgi:small subunit ribosomal protein S4
MAQKTAQSDRNERSAQATGKKPMRKMSEYGRQLAEKQKVKEMYGMREKQFKRFFDLALRARMSTGEALLVFLERRLDNVVFRLKFAATRPQARQVVVHGHVFVNGKRVSSPSYLVKDGDVISFAPNVADKAGLLKEVIEKRLASPAKVPDWLELDKKERTGRVLRSPVREDLGAAPIEEHYIVELYSK